MTFYNEDLKTHFGFFGRTYNGAKRELVDSLKKSATGEKLYRCEVPEFVFFHSSLAKGKTKLVIEITFIQESILKTGNRETLKSGTGYAVVDPLDTQAQKIVYHITSGSPRYIGKESDIVLQ
jgi:hypothetical protein